MIALRGLVVFPNSTVHFDVGRKRSAAALDLAIKKGTPVFLVTQRDVRHDDPDLGELYDIGTIAVIKQVLRISDDNIRVLVEGVSRGRILELVSGKNARQAGFEACARPAGQGPLRP